MKRCWIFLVSVLTLAPALPAQTIYKPPKENLDSVHLRLRHTLEELRDSLGMLDAVAARIQRDLDRSSDAVVLARGGALRDQCRTGAAMAAATGERVGTIGLPAPDQRKQLPLFRLALDTLGANLTQCARDFDAMSTTAKIAELRGYAMSRAIRAQSALRRYEGALQAYLGAVGFGLTQLRSGGKTSRN
jgi:hypothetical protein